MTEAQGSSRDNISGSSKKTQLTVDEKRIIARRKVETGHSENVVAAWFNRKPVTLEEAKRTSLLLSEFVGDNIALFSEEGYRTLLHSGWNPDSIKFGCHGRC